MYEIREIIKIVLVQFHQIYLISLLKYIGISVTNSNCSCCRLHLSISYISLCSDSVIPVEKILNSFHTERWVRNSRTRTPCYETVNGWAPFLLFQQVGPLLQYFNGWGPFIIISTGGAPSLLFQRVGPFFIISMGGTFLLFQRVHGAPSLLFQRVGPLLYHFKGCIGPCSFVLTFRWLLIDINFRSNYSHIVHFQV